MNISDLSFHLLHKYNVQGPRYTSYPPAPSWKNDIGPLDYQDQIEKSNIRGVPLSLYFHLPFCEKLCYFCGCTTVITGQNRSFVEPYMKSIWAELGWLSARINRKRPIVQLHLGGGTPTYNTPESLEELMNKVRKDFYLDPEAEIGVEVDPRVTSLDHLKSLRRAGFNRLSMGVQDFDAAVQNSINRRQSFEDTRKLVDQARLLGFNSINMDLIYGLPYQTTLSFDETISQILSIGPDRLAVYSYAHVPWLKKHQAPLEAHLPDEKEKFEIFLTALRRFTEAGFEYIGMDHFARPDDELAKARRERTLWRNFQGYTTKAGTDLFGLGMSAIGSVSGTYFQNQKDLREYQAAITKNKAATARGFHLSEDDKIRSRVIQNLLCHAEVRKQEIEKEFKITFDVYFSSALKKLEEPAADGLVELTPTMIRPTGVGRIFLRNLAMAFDAYLPKEGDKQIFSRTV